MVAAHAAAAPVAVRYGYASRFKWANLYNVRDLVAGPFEADVQPAP